MDAFLDTNLTIAYVFQFNSHHLKSKEVFEIYSNFFWSSFVEDEFDVRYTEKKEHLSLFFNDLDKYLENPQRELYSVNNLFDFARKNYAGKMLGDAVSSINPFWDRYFGFESQIPFFRLKNGADFCLNDLSINLNTHKFNLKKLIRLTPKRTKNYSKIDKMLRSNGVHSEDRTVILDGHDFACNIKNPIDFVSFDDDCFEGAKSVKTLCFNAVKGKNDFRPC